MILIYIIISSFICFSKDGSAVSDIVIQSLDTNLKLNKLSNIYDKRAKLPSRAQKKSNLPSVKFRDKVFNKAKLQSFVSKMDDVDRDLFYLKIKKFSPKELIIKYPELSKDQIRHAKRLIKAQK